MTKMNCYFINSLRCRKCCLIKGPNVCQRNDERKRNDLLQTASSSCWTMSTLKPHSSANPQTAYLVGLERGEAWKRRLNETSLQPRITQRMYSRVIGFWILKHQETSFHHAEWMEEGTSVHFEEIGWELIKKSQIISSPALYTITFTDMNRGHPYFEEGIFLHCRVTFGSAVGLIEKGRGKCPSTAREDSVSGVGASFYKGHRASHSFSLCLLFLMARI